MEGERKEGGHCAIDDNIFGESFSTSWERAAAWEYSPGDSVILSLSTTAGKPSWKHLEMGSCIPHMGRGTVVEMSARRKLNTL